MIDDPVGREGIYLGTKYVVAKYILSLPLKPLASWHDIKGHHPFWPFELVLNLMHRRAFVLGHDLLKQPTYYAQARSYTAL